MQNVEEYINELPWLGWGDTAYCQEDVKTLINGNIIVFARWMANEFNIEIIEVDGVVNDEKGIESRNEILDL